MQRFLAASRTLYHESRKGHLILFAACIAIAVTATSTVNLFTDRLQRAFIKHSNEVIAADVRLSSFRPFETTLLNTIPADTTQASLQLLRATIRHHDKFQLVEVKAASSGYPLRGQLRIKTVDNPHEHTTTTLPQVNEAWLEARLADTLKINIGDALKLGDLSLNVTAILTYEPDQTPDFLNNAPRVLIHDETLKHSGLLQPGSRVNYQHLLKTDKADTKLSDWAASINDPYIQIQTVGNTQPTLNAALERAEQFLNFAAFISLMLAAAGIALCAHHYAYQQMDTIATLSALGLTTWQRWQWLLTKLLCITFIAIAIGIGLSLILQTVLLRIVQPILPLALPALRLWYALPGAFMGLLVTMCFALPAMHHLCHVPPMRVLRRDFTHQPVPRHYYIYAIGVLLGLAVYSVKSLTTGLMLSGSLLLTLAVLWISAYGILRLSLIGSRQIANKESLWHTALHNRRSPLTHTLLQITLLAFGTLILIVLIIVRGDLVREWRNQIPDKAPNQFAINIPATTMPDLKLALQNHDIAPILYPIARARITTHNHQPLDIEKLESSRAQRLAVREYVISGIENLPEQNTLITGHFPPQQTSEKIEISVDQELASLLGWQLNDSVSFLINDQPIDTVITSLRQIHWESAEVNFFILFPESFIHTLPVSYITAFHWPYEDEKLLPLLEQFPQISFINVGNIMTRIQELVSKVSLAVTCIFALTFVMSILILWSSLQNTLATRQRELALLRAIGVSQKQLRQLLNYEFIWTGLAVSILATICSLFIGIGLVWQWFDVVMRPSWGLLLISAGVTTFLVWRLALFGCQRSLKVSPMSLLRGNDA